MSYNIPKSALALDFVQKVEAFSVFGVYQLKTWTVGPTGDFATLPAALSSLSIKAGDRLLIEAGFSIIAATPIVIDKDVTIEGQPGGSLVTASDGTPANLFDIQTDNVYLKNLNFQAYSTGSCIGTSTSKAANLFVESCQFSGPSVLLCSGNNIQFKNSSLFRDTATVSRSPIRITCSGMGSGEVSGNGSIINIENCVFNDFAANGTTAIQINFETDVTTPVRVSGCTYQQNPFNALLQFSTGTATTNSKIPVWVQNNNIGTGNILVKLQVGNQTSPLLLDNFSYIYLSGNTIVNTSGYGFVACERGGSSPATIALGSNDLLFATGNTSTNPTTVRAGWAAGTSEGSTVLLTYNAAKFTAYSRSETALNVSAISVPDFSPLRGIFVKVDGTNADNGSFVLLPDSWNSSFTGVYQVRSGTENWTKVLSPSDLSSGSLILPEQGNVFDKTLWISSGGSISKLTSGPVYGGGADGDVTISSATTLTSDKYYRNLTVTSALNPGGYRIFVSELLTIGYAGSISMDGADGSGTTAGTGYAGVGTLQISSGSGGAGGNGGVAVSAGSPGGSPLTSGYVTPYFVGVASTTFEGGVGSTGSAAGGTAGTVPTALLLSGGFDNPADFQAGFSLRTGSSFTGGAGGGGGGGSSSVSNTGGGGGAGGGGVWISASRIQNSGKITANGGDGGNGVGTAGGGAGGGGGWVAIQYGSGDLGRVSANGGKTGTGGTASTAARAGRVTLKVI